MACSNPNLVLFKDDFGVISSTFIGSAKPFDIRKLPLHYSDLFTHGYYYNVVPCGKCPGCRMDYSRVWANRMLVELNDMDNTAVFLTLTYNSDNLPYTALMTLAVGIQHFLNVTYSYFGNDFGKLFPVDALDIILQVSMARRHTVLIIMLLCMAYVYRISLTWSFFVLMALDSLL